MRVTHISLLLLLLLLLLFLTSVHFVSVYTPNAYLAFTPTCILHSTVETLEARHGDIVHDYIQFVCLRNWAVINKSLHVEQVSTAVVSVKVSE
jgi:hypothetical protein